MTADNPIPRDWHDAFQQVTMQFQKWTPSNFNHQFSVDQRPHSIDAVCRHVLIYNDKLPDNLLAVLHGYLSPAQHLDLEAELSQHPTYAVGAQCLLELMERRQAEYRRRGL